jgi:23S rRNA-/tRNA-specific pseudouridylate synthase
VVQLIVPKAKPDSGLVVPVLFEDEHMAVVLKPAGVKIHGRGNTVRVTANLRVRQGGWPRCVRAGLGGLGASGLAWVA